MTSVIQDRDLSASAPELTALGKRLEILRIERGVSKQRLAAHAGTSRQQLWRVMTGKSELTNSLRDRLASALAIESATLLSSTASGTETSSSSSISTFTPTSSSAPLSIGEYSSDTQYLATTLRTLPSGDCGRRLKRALLNALEDLAVEGTCALPADYPEIHRRVLAGEL